MKKALIVLVLSLFTVGFASAQTGDAEAKIKTSAVCKMCKKTIETALAYEKGVKAVTLDVDTKVATITYNPKKTDVAKLRQAISKSGYDADEVPAQEKAYNQLDDCCKKDAGDH